MNRASSAILESYATLAKNYFENKGNIVKVWDIAFEGWNRENRMPSTSITPTF